MSDASAFTVGTPAEVDRFDKEAHVGHLLLFFAPTVEAMNTAFGEADAAACQAVVCVPCLKGWSDQKVFGSALVPALCGSMDPVVAGILYQGDAKPGRQPPWLLATPDADELADATGVANRIVSKLPSGKLHVDLDALSF